MRLHIMSDLHLEVMREGSFLPAKPPSDAVVLAGDIHNSTKGLDWARATFPDSEVVYVAGNHEFYGQVWSHTEPALRKRAMELSIRYLENDQIVINGVRFLGTTLWTDFELYGTEMREPCMQAAKGYMADYGCINFRKLRPEDAEPGIGRLIKLTPSQTAKWHQQARAFLADHLSVPFAGKTVVVTHHLPSLRSVAARFAGDPTNGAFASNLDHLIGQADLWVHGHTHDSVDYAFGNRARVVCNPRGYLRYDGKRENRSFRSDVVVEI